ncbi:unnamed protein product [Ilex paraguariensis]|uniref:DNA/RNA-binding protein Kin17 WH-like domain-containing protein n=1 Tax=Ilex paraguariensis TaxID=185542 RepID=A0ABC8QSP5_9AQUA
MRQKQCRDENGFKCHCMSESHQRQMVVFGQNPNHIVDGYSEEFEIAFLEHMKRSHRFSSVTAKVVYNEYIADRHYIHMNSTQWATLTEFVKDSETLFKENMKNKRIKADLAEEEKQERDIRKQIELAEQLMPVANGSKLQPLESQPKLMKLENGQKVSSSLGSSSKIVGKEKLESSRLVFEDVEEDKKSGKCKDNCKLGKSGGGRSALDELIREQEKAK